MSLPIDNSLLIFHAAAADRVVRFAGRELARYLGRMTGREFPLAESATWPPRTPAQGGILLHTGPWCAAAATQPSGDAAAVDSFTRCWQDGWLILTGVNSRSVLYAVYDLLEELGCRFTEPGLETIPSLPAPLALPRQTKSETAAFRLRSIFRTAVATRHDEVFTFLDSALVEQEVDWLAKRRLNRYTFYVDYYRYDLWEKHKGPILASLLDRGFEIEVSFHSVHYFCPPDENHDFGGFGPESYLRNHPEWYIPALECGGRGHWQTRVELPAVRDLITRRYLEYVARNPELSTIGIWPDDVPMNNPDPRHAPADGYLEFWNHVAEPLATRAPAQTLGIIAYFELIRPPRHQRPRANEHVWFCPLERNYQYPIAHPENRHWLEPLQRWTGLMAPGRLGLFEYYGWAVPFIPFRDIFRADAPLYLERNVPGLYAWAGFTRNILGQDSRWALDFHCLSALLWNPAADLRRLEEAWAQAVFGAAAEPVLACVDLLKTEHQAQATAGLGGYFGWKSDYNWLTLDLLRKLLPRFDAARRAATTTAAAQRINLIEKLAARAATDSVCRTSEEPPPAYWENGK